MKFTSILSYLALAAATAAAPLAEEPVRALAEADNISARGTNANEARDVKMNCIIHVMWTKNWSEHALRRYQVKGEIESGTTGKDHDKLFEEWRAQMGDPSSLANLQYYVDPTAGFRRLVDCSFAEGTLGHNDYVNFHQGVLEQWHKSTGCDIDYTL